MITLVIISSQFQAIAQQVSPSFIPKGDIKQPVITITIPIFEFSLDNIDFQDLKAQGYNTISLLFEWRDLEQNYDEYNFEQIDMVYKKIIDYGFMTIPTFDFSGRPSEKAPSVQIDAEANHPTWLIDESDLMMKTFYGNDTYQLRLNSHEVMIELFEVLTLFTSHLAKYKDYIIAVGIGQSPEVELKYGQKGFQWRDYSGAAQQRFITLTGSTMPIMDYNNRSNQEPRYEPLFTVLQGSRMLELQDLVCNLSYIIHKQGFKTIGYFGELFSIFDAIYLTHSLETLSSCVDFAVLDYNFYDGYTIKNETEIVEIMSLYAKNLGYEGIIGGLYFERLAPPNGTGVYTDTEKLVPIEYLDSITETANTIAKIPGYLGLEIGNIYRETDIKNVIESATSVNFETLTYDTSNLILDEPKITVGILASSTNFNLWHGDFDGAIMPSRKALLTLYNLLKKDSRFNIEIIGEPHFDGRIKLPSNIDIVVATHQVGMSDQALLGLRNFWENGGKIVQDMQLGSYNMNGEHRNSWLNDIFGIGGLSWQKEGKFTSLTDTFSIDFLEDSDKRFAIFAPVENYTNLLQTNDGVGIMLRGERSLVTGIMLHHIEENQELVQFIINEIYELAQ